MDRQQPPQTERKILSKRDEASLKLRKKVQILVVAAMMLGTGSSETKNISCGIETDLGKISLICNGKSEMIDDSYVHKDSRDTVSVASLLEDPETRDSFSKYQEQVRNSGLEILGDPTILNPNQNCYGYAIDHAYRGLSLGKDVWLEETGAQKILNSLSKKFQTSPDDLSSLPNGNVKIGDVVLFTLQDKSTGEIFPLHAAIVAKDAHDQITFIGKDAEQYVLSGNLQNTFSYYASGTPENMNRVLVVYRN